MRFEDIREFVDFLENRGELVRIKALVDANLEITEITDRVVKNGGPALLFENVAGTNIPVLTNIYGSKKRIAWALGGDDIEHVPNRIRKLLGMVQGGPPEGFLNKAKALMDLIKVAGSQPKMIRNAPCQEVVLTGSDIDLYKFPVLKCWPMDGGPFITLPLVITKDPVSGARNVGAYRMQVFDKQTTGMHWQTQKGGTHHERVAIQQGISKLEVAVALGGDPATLWTGTAPLPPDLDELVVAGFIREKGVDLVKCVTVDLEVPANAEIILEGYVVPGERRIEGPFGDHTGLYSLADDYPVFHITAITHRLNPIYPTIIVGRPVQEDFFMGKATERIFLPIIQMVLPEVVDMNMPAEGVFHNLVIVSIRKEYPGQASKVMYALWGMGLMMLAKAIIVVDESVNVQDVSEVAWRVTNNLNADQDIIYASGPVDDLDHSSTMPKYGSKIGIDATNKGNMDDRQREWPPDIEMSQEIKNLVSNRWAEYGIE